MKSIHVSLEYSAWWLLPLFIFSAALTWWMYAGKNSWTKGIRMGLAALRFFTFFLVGLLLLNPKITSIVSFKEKPLFPILVDDSQSISLGTNKLNDLTSFVGELQQRLDDKGFESKVVTFTQLDAAKDSLTFRAPSSDLTHLLDQGVTLLGESKNGRMLLVSDGIYNSGISPVYKAYPPDVWTLGIGDTVPRKDIAIKSLQNNSVAFLGNKFPLRANVRIIGYKGQQIEVLLKGSKGTLDRQKIQVKDEFDSQSLDFLIQATDKGFQRYTVEIAPLKGESNEFNNKLNAYVDVIDDRENVLIVSKSPHPSIKTFHSALEKLENIHLEVLIPGISTPKATEYDLVVLLNCLRTEVPEAQKFIKERTSLFYIAGSLMDFGAFNKENGLVEVASQSQTDQVQAVVNPGFSRFKMEEEAQKAFGSLPPVEVPFGEIRPKAGAEILLYQKISSVESEKPLMLLGSTPRKTGVLLTDGLWLWRMYAYQESKSTALVDGLVTKCVQYLSSKEDKRKFRIYTHQKEYLESEIPRVEVELYNDLFERVYGQTATFTIVDQLNKVRKYNFVPSEGNTALVLPNLPPGVYKVLAKALINGKSHEAKAEFVVREMNLEALDLQGNHQLLRELSHKNNGHFFAWENRDKLIGAISQLEANPLWKTSEESRGLIDEKWYFFLIISLATAEWAIRRYSGAY